MLAILESIAIGILIRINYKLFALCALNVALKYIDTKLKGILYCLVSEFKNRFILGGYIYLNI